MRKNRNVFIEFLCILSLIVSILGCGLSLFEENFAMFLIQLLIFPFSVVSLGKCVHLLLKLFYKEEIELWEKILVPLFGVIALANFLPIKPVNYQVSWCNPQVRMVAYQSDCEAWRGGEAFVFRSDSMVEYRLAYREENGAVIHSFPYSRRKDTIFFQNDTIFKHDTLLINEDGMENPHSKSYKSFEIIFDKDSE